MNIFVTGGTGFIGSHLVKELISRSFNVYTPQSALGGKKFDLVDTFTIDACKPLLAKSDSVVHLAARVHIMNDEDKDSAKLYQDINLNGTLHLARIAAASGVKRFVFVSSIKACGEYTAGEAFSEFSEDKPEDEYGMSKLQAEIELKKIAEQGGMQLVILRPPLVYGSGVKANFYSLLKLADKSVPLPLGSVTNSRSMVYVGNLVDALIQCATHPKAAGQTYLVSDGQDVSTSQLVTMIADAMKKPSRVFRFPISLMRLGAALLGRTSMVDRLTQSLVVDSSKIRNDLAWTPPYTMSQGIQETADWYLHSKHSHHD